MTIAKKGYFLPLEQNHILGEALIKEPPGNAQLFRLARRDFFEAGVDSSVLYSFKKVKQRSQTE